jgi:hypothetical protein
MTTIGRDKVRHSLLQVQTSTGPTLAQPRIQISTDTYLFDILNNYGLGGHLPKPTRTNLSLTISSTDEYVTVVNQDKIDHVTCSH